jgi:uncharacterized protein involved in exopolysaccharide biosynthesis
MVARRPDTTVSLSVTAVINETMSAPQKTIRRVRPDGATAALGQTPGPTPDALGPLRSILRRWPVVVAVTALIVATAIAAALLQAPTYTASADVNVGRVDVRVQSLPGYVAGAQALASAYSRVTTSDEVVTPLARRLGLSEGAVRSRLGATPVPEATIFRIFGSGSDVRDAVGFTRAATAQVEAYVGSRDDGRQALGDTLSAYREQSRTAAGLRERIERLRDQQTAATASVTATPSGSDARRARERRSAEIARLQVALDTAELKMQSLGSRYQERGNELAATAGIEVISRPVTAASDRQRTLQRLLAVGLVAGVLLGSGLALVIDRRRV